MRTTIDVPPELMRAVKTRAAERGERLKDLFARALAREVGTSGQPSARVVLPLVGRDDEPRADVTNAEIEAALSGEEAERYGER